MWNLKLLKNINPKNTVSQSRPTTHTSLHNNGRLKLSANSWMLGMARVDEHIAWEVALYDGPQLSQQNKIHNNKFKLLKSNYK